MEDFKFYALMGRLKYIDRWSLMRNTRNENVAEHSYFTSLITHALCCIDNALYGGNVNADKAAAIALYHETAEVITGDLPTPVKYRNDEITGAYKRIERAAEDKMLGFLPSELTEPIGGYIRPDTKSREYKFVKLADKLSAYIKCLEEKACGNSEFDMALVSIAQSLQSEDEPALKYFTDRFIAAYKRTLDENIFEPQD